VLISLIALLLLFLLLRLESLVLLLPLAARQSAQHVDHGVVGPLALGRGRESLAAVAARAFGRLLQLRQNGVEHEPSHRRHRAPGSADQRAAHANR